MSITIEEVQAQINQLQKLLETLKDPVLEISRSFTGQYFKPFQGKQYRRMESEGIPIWEQYYETKKDWVILNNLDSKSLEELFIKTFLSTDYVEEIKEKDEVVVED